VKAAVISSPGVVRIETVEDPAPGPRDVVVKVAACGLCGTDLHILQGEFAPTLPIVPGHEFAGEVVALGAEVRDLSVGDQVAADPSLYCHECHYCRLGRNNLCERWAAIGVTAPGGAAEYAVAPAATQFNSRFTMSTVGGVPSESVMLPLLLGLALVVVAVTGNEVVGATAWIVGVEIASR